MPRGYKPKPQQRRSRAARTPLAADAAAGPASMPTARDCLGVAALGGKIFAVGGIKARCALRTAEAYDPQTNTWAALASMCTPRCSFGLAAVQGRLFAAGGYADNGKEVTLDSVEAHDPQLDRCWTTVAPMSAPRSAFALVAG